MAKGNTHKVSKSRAVLSEEAERKRDEHRAGKTQVVKTGLFGRTKVTKYGR